MQTQEVLTHDTNVEISLSILHDIFSGYHPRNFAVRLWDDTRWEPEPGQPSRFTMILRHPGALRQMFLHISPLAFGEAYIYDDMDVEGDIEAAFEMTGHLFGMRLSLAEKIHLGGLLRKLPSDGKPRVGRQAAHLTGALHSRERDRQAVTYHYDVANDFFALWLDRRMVYSCGYFRTPEEDLDIAQEAKLEYICRKLRLRPGERLLDLGCGWGALIMHAARRYGVAALGITLSEPQARLANERIAAEGLQDRCRAEVRDYRDIDTWGQYDKIVSVGMVEHVGESMLPEYFDRARRLLRPGGVFLNHGIALGVRYEPGKGLSFSDRYIFPDSALVSIDSTLRCAEESGFEVRDVENLREHYVLTLRHWRRRLEERYNDVRKVVDEPTYRIWRLMQAGSAQNFERGQHAVYQALLVKPVSGESRFPLTRADWYA